MIKKRVAGILGALFVGVCAAAAFAAGAGEGEMAVFTMSAKGESCIQVETGKLFAIRFLSSPGTGYSWEFAAGPDKKMLEFIGEKIEEPGSRRLGGSESVIWTFRALSAGDTEISMKYVRPWEKQLPPARIYVFNVRVR